jgi:nucleolar protein 4
MFPELADVSDNGNDSDTSDNLVGEDGGSELDQETSNHPSEDDFKAETDISKKIFENLIKSSEKSEPYGVMDSDIDTDTETENDTSEKKEPDLPVAGIVSGRCNGVSLVPFILCLCFAMCFFVMLMHSFFNR